MSRRPVDTQKRHPIMGNGQQAIWDEIRQLGDFTITDIDGVVDMHRKSIINYVKRLQAGGVVKQADDFATSFRYILLKDTGRVAPRLQKDGSPVTMGGGTASMWRTMRMMPQFTVVDLVAHSPEKTPVKITSAKDYCKMLSKAGYLRVMRKANPFQKRFALYKLIRNHGPLPPQIQRVQQVFDPNIGKVVYTPGVDL